jgi:hypothetical protein
MNPDSRDLTTLILSILEFDLDDRKENGHGPNDFRKV